MMLQRQQKGKLNGVTLNRARKLKLHANLSGEGVELQVIREAGSPVSAVETDAVTRGWKTLATADMKTMIL